MAPIATGVRLRRRRRALLVLGALGAVAVAGGAIVGARGGPDWRRGVASVFFQYGTPLACGGRLEQATLGVAHRALPCGAPITFRHHGRMLTVAVVDRGPFVAGRDFDLTPAAAARLDLSGVADVDWHR